MICEKNGFFLCQNCPRTFVTSVVYSRHIVTAHKIKEDLTTPNQKKTGVLQCRKNISGVSYTVQINASQSEICQLEVTNTTEDNGSIKASCNNPYLEENSTKKSDVNHYAETNKKVNTKNQQQCKSVRKSKNAAKVEIKVTEVKDSIFEELKYHQSLDPNQCEECKKSYKSKFYLKLHIGLTRSMLQV